ncbi:DRC8 protein, partial [Centropus bengalensis]|nr:DRC8 protein [Centropus bengalensis]
REIGVIMRSLGCFPTEAEVQEVIAKVNVEEEPPSGYIHLEKFLPMMTKILLDKRYMVKATSSILFLFLKALDENKCGSISKDDLVKYLTEE